MVHLEGDGGWSGTALKPASQRIPHTREMENLEAQIRTLGLGAFCPAAETPRMQMQVLLPASCCLGVSWASWREQVETARWNEWAAEEAASGLERLAGKLTLTNLLH